MRGQQQRRVTITPRIAGILGCLAAAVLGYGAIAVIVQGHSAIRTQWRAAVVIGGGASVGLLALTAAVLVMVVAASACVPRAVPGSDGGGRRAGADCLGGIACGRRQRSGDEPMAGRPRGRFRAGGMPRDGGPALAHLAEAITGRSRRRAWQARDRGHHRAAMAGRSAGPAWAGCPGLFERQPWRTQCTRRIMASWSWTRIAVTWPRCGW